jgi:hypothetical protein
VYNLLTNIPNNNNNNNNNNPNHLEELEEAIVNACNSVTVQMLENAFENMSRGRHFEHFR